MQNYTSLQRSTSMRLLTFFPFFLLFLNQSQSINQHIYFNIYGASSANKSAVMEDYNTCRKHKYEHFLLLVLFLYDWADLKLKRHCFERSGCCFPISSRSKNERHFYVGLCSPWFHMSRCSSLANLYGIWVLFEEEHMRRFLEDQAQYLHQEMGHIW